jgi:DNA-binding CsgD family transcriptional regulator
VTPIHGRDRELSVLDSVVADLPHHEGLVVAGEPGIGTSALLAAAGRRASQRGVRVLAARGLPRTRDRPLAALGEVLGLLGDAPPSAPSETLPELATRALAAAAEARPTLLLLDDGDLVDDLSWDALTQAARRLHDRPFALVVALGEGSPRLRGEGLPVLTIGPLGDAAARAVLAEAAAGLPTFVTERIVEAAAGNPMALVELAGATPAQWRVQCVRPPIALPLSPRLVRGFAAEVEELPVETREVLLAAAANDAPSLSEAVRAAAATLKADTEATLAACLAAFERRIVEGDAVTIRFRSEAARSAIYQAASLPRRHAMHIALARLLAESEPHRAAWHRAAASLMPDEALATELAGAAAAVRSRGRIRDALATMDRAARVSQDPVARVPRLLEAAEMAHEIGRADFVTAFLDQATGLVQTSEHRHWIAMLQGLYDLWRPDDGTQARELIAAAEAAHDAGDAAWTRTLLTRLVEKANVLRADRAPKAELARAARALGGPEGTGALVGPLAVVAPVEHGAEVLAHLRAASPDAGGDPRLARVYGDAAMTLGDDHLAAGFLSASVDRLRLEGRLGLLPFALLDRARVLLGIAGHAPALVDVVEGAKLAGETAQPILVGRFRALEARIAALEGDAERAEALAGEAERAALGRTALLVDVHVARGTARLTAGDHEGAFVMLMRLWDDDAPLMAVSRRWGTIGDLAEAAAAIGRPEAVAPLVEGLALTAAAVGSPLLMVTVPHARAALGRDADVEADLRAGREAALRRGPFAAGRTHLAYGAWLRRRRRVSEGRLELRAAVAAFDAAGATGWAQRARAELRAAGAPTTVAPSKALEELTAHELQIAELAASGLTNREIGARLHLSPRTISTHLYRTFPKLGVTSRAQLRAALDGLRQAS